ncbi:MAG: hypothetical protein Kow00121_08240 [Elainellaceae cyanobacterium]
MTILSVNVLQRKWKLIGVKVAVWLIAEITLSLAGTDNLADYSEFVFDQEVHCSQYPCQVLLIKNYIKLAGRDS